MPCTTLLCGCKLQTRAVSLTEQGRLRNTQAAPPATMFWGLEINSQYPLSMTVDRSFHISKAVLVTPNEDQHYFNVNVHLKGGHDETPIQICKFLPNTSESPLDLNITRGDNITFSVSPGHVVVHLSGYYLDAQEIARATRIARADLKMDQLVDICNRILERTYHIN